MQVLLGEKKQKYLNNFKLIICNKHNLNSLLVNVKNELLLLT